jgi:O-antigen/teichoic acid export membrane protein
LITPFIVHFLGPKSYGLVGFYATITLFLAFLDQAVSPTLTRELARSAHQADAARSLRCLLRSLELLSGGIAVVLGAVMAGGAPLIARHWLANSGIPEPELIDAIRLMGLSLACQWPAALYSGGFVGLRRQDLLVPVRVIITTVQSVGAVVLLSKVSASPLLFFAWMAATSALLSVVLRVFLWRMMPPSQEPARFDPDVLRTVWRFATGNLVIGLTTALLTQSGGLIIAKYCALEQLAAYTLAVSLAGQVSTILVQPVSATLMPHFAHLTSQRDAARLAREYHRWSQIFAALILPITGTLIVFGRPLLQIWLGSASPLVNPVSELLPWIAIGTLLNTLMTPSYFLQIANGWTSLIVTMNFIALAVILPALVIAVPRYGPIAAAVCWIGINLPYYGIMVPRMHQRLLPSELWAWWGRDTLLPIAVVGIIYGSALTLTPFDVSRFVGLAAAIAVAALAWAALLVVLPQVRTDAFGVLNMVKLKLARVG